MLELAPGWAAPPPRSWRGIRARTWARRSDVDAANVVRGVLAGRGEVKVADAADTGLPDASADVVIGEAMLTMQGDVAKHAIVAEAVRVLRPRGRYAIHELALTPDSVSEEVATTIGSRLPARSRSTRAR